MRLILRRRARVGVLDAAIWYESQRPKLGAELKEEVARLLARIAEAPSSSR